MTAAFIHMAALYHDGTTRYWALIERDAATRMMSQPQPWGRWVAVS